MKSKIQVGLAGLLNRFKDYLLVVEVRHGSWNKPSVYQSLEGRRVEFCNIDQPLFARSMWPSAKVTSKVGYVRLHGRNYENWFSKSAGAAERYDYLYSTEELRPWMENIKAMAESAGETYVITNNYFQGKAAANALEIKSQFAGEKVPDISVVATTSVLRSLRQYYYYCLISSWDSKASCPLSNDPDGISNL